MSKDITANFPENPTAHDINYVRDLTVLLHAHLEAVKKSDAGILMIVKMLADKGIIDVEKDFLPLAEWSQQAAIKMNSNLILTNERLSEWVRSAQEKRKSASA